MGLSQQMTILNAIQLNKGTNQSHPIPAVAAYWLTFLPHKFYFWLFYAYFTKLYSGVLELYILTLKLINFLCWDDML